MKVHEGIPKERIPGLVLTVGSYDGVHLGHQKLLSTVVQAAKERNGQSALLTFHPHPRVVLHGQDAPQLLTTARERERKLEALGLDHLIVLPFTRELSEMSPVMFVRDLLVNQVGMTGMVVGYDHRFGKNREGDKELLMEYADVYGFDVVEFPAQMVDEVKVSSTKIRRALKEGNVELARSFLGESYMISGEVVHGDQLGRMLGYPTANIEVDHPRKLIPANGIYLVKTFMGSMFLGYGMMNVGVRPTVSSGEGVKLEVHIFDLDRDLYGETIRVEFLQFIREEQRFESTDHLKHAIAADEIICRKRIAELGAE